MARSGILYSHVMKAAALVAADGRNPTVDNVREALGGTGSKSTIAPLLKRWKEEHQFAPEQTELGLPVELVGAMQSLVEKLRLDANRQLEQVRAEHQAYLEEAYEKLKKGEGMLAELAGIKNALSAELGTTQAALAQLKEEHHHRAVTLATLHSDNFGLTQRLDDRAAEVAALHGQLAQMRGQFEHYQEAAAAQRTEERHAFEQRHDRLQQEHGAVLQRLASQQHGIAQQEMQLAQLQLDNGRLGDTLAAAQDQLAQVRPERDQLRFQYDQAANATQALASQLDATRQTLMQARMDCAGHEKEAAMLGASLAAAQQREQQMARDTLELQRHNAALQSQAEQRLADDDQPAL